MNTLNLIYIGKLSSSQFRWRT